MFGRKRKRAVELDSSVVEEPLDDTTTDASTSADAESAATSEDAESGDRPRVAGGSATAPTSPNRGVDHGPWDQTELPDGGREGRIDVGALRIRGYEGLELQLQYNPETQEVGAAMLIDGDGALQLLALAAPKSGGLWAEGVEALQEDIARNGGKSEVIQGPFGPLIRALVPQPGPDGSMSLQPAVLIGAEGPRWLLRGTLYGRAAVEQETMNRMVAVFQETVVVRGPEARSPGENLPLVIPPNMQAAGPLAPADDDNGEGQ